MGEMAGMRAGEYATIMQLINLEILKGNLTNKQMEMRKKYGLFFFVF